MKITHFTEEELNKLTAEFEKWFNERKNHIRARYWLMFLFLRYTGARISEIQNLKETDIDFRNAEIKLITKKRRKETYRIVPVPQQLISEYLLLAKTLNVRDVNVKQPNFYNVFRMLCKKAGITDPEKQHPHVLRHTRAIELLRNGIPITAVQSVMGHASVTVTARYLQFTNVEIKEMLKQKNLI